MKDSNPSVSPPISSVYGPWSTLGLSFAIYLLFTFVQTIAGIFYICVLFLLEGGFDSGGKEVIDSLVAGLGTDGTYLAIATIFSGVACVFCIWGVVQLKKGLNFADYIGWKQPSLIGLFKLFLLSAVWLVCIESITVYLDRQSEFMLDIYSSSHSKILLLFAINIVAPIWEEIFFRGFLFKGLQNSRLGNYGAVFITAFLFALIHVQYDWFGMLTILMLGIILGMVRWKTDSVVGCMWIHAINNIASSIFTILAVNA